MHSKRVEQRGLTLIELLVAISVLGFVAVLGWRGLDSIVRARIALTAALEQTRGMQITFAQLQSDCAHLAPPSVLLNRMPLIIEPERLSLVRTVFVDNQPSRLQVVTYQLRDNVLTRRESAAIRDLKELDVLWSGSLRGSDASGAVVLQSDVTAMTMRVWSNGSWSMGARAQPIVNPADNPDVPSGLEVTLHLRGHDASILKIFLLGAV
jgi:general secretion pathway protein J